MLLTEWISLYFKRYNTGSDWITFLLSKIKTGEKYEYNFKILQEFYIAKLLHVT